VAIPVFPLTAWIAISVFQTPCSQIIGAALAMFTVYQGALWIDTIPLLRKKICSPKDAEAETPMKSCEASGFNYCQFSQMLLAIAVVPLMIWIAMSVFPTPCSKIIGSALVIFVLYQTVAWLNNTPLLKKKIYNPTNA
jgi:hypothetical protein